MKRLLTIGHSYVVGLNRRLAHEFARMGVGRWEVVAAAPTFVHGDLRPISLEAVPNEACRLEPVSAYLTKRIHVMFYGRRVRSLLADRWDVVHAWEEPYILPGYQLAQWTRRPSKFVFYTYQNLSKRYPPPFSWFERSVIHRADGWLAGGKTVAEVLLPRLGYAKKPHRLITLGVDVNVFRPDPASRSAVRAALGWTEDGPPVVGFLGRFTPEKGPRLLTRVLDRVPLAWRALLVGGGPLEAELKAWAATKGDRVRVVTGVPHDGVPAYLNAMDILAAPSQTLRRWKEQLGRMLIEAFACGVPVIGSDSGEIPHVIADAGKVVSEADESAWAAALTELLDSPAQRAELAMRGRQRAETTFAWSVIAAQHLDFFETLL
jgi:glycosyltransferase involved in cell wall biosynthesis